MTPGDDEERYWITDEGKCSACGWPIKDFEDLEALDFQAEVSGRAPNPISGDVMHWAYGTVACPICKARLPYATTS